MNGTAAVALRSDRWARFLEPPASTTTAAVDTAIGEESYTGSLEPQSRAFPIPSGVIQVARTSSIPDTARAAKPRTVLWEVINAFALGALVGRAWTRKYEVSEEHSIEPEELSLSDAANRVITAVTSLEVDPFEGIHVYRRPKKVIFIDDLTLSLNQLPRSRPRVNLDFGPYNADE